MSGAELQTLVMARRSSESAASIRKGYPPGWFVMVQALTSSRDPAGCEGVRNKNQCSASRNRSKWKLVGRSAEISNLIALLEMG